MYAAAGSPTMPSTKDQINFRISPQGKKILLALQDRYGTSQAGVFERLLRDEAVRLNQTEGWKPERKLGGR